MNEAQLLELLKMKLGISTSLRDDLLEKVIAGVVSELQDNLGVSLDPERNDHEMFVVDYAAYRYEGKSEGLPRHLQWRLQNLKVSSNKEV